MSNPVTSFLQTQGIRFQIVSETKGELVLFVWVKAKPNSKKERIEIDTAGEIIVAVNARPVDGEANIAIVESLSKKMGMAKSMIQIEKGATSKSKKVQIIFSEKGEKDFLFYTEKLRNLFNEN